MRPSLVLALTCTLLAAPAAAQGVAGTLVEASGAPLGGALVTLLDGRGRVVATASSRPDGSFVLRAPSAGEYRVKAERIGHATTLSAPLALRAGETASLRLASAGKGVQLEGLQVAAGERGCVINPRSGARTAALWEEARKALTATRFQEESGAAIYTVRRFSRELDAATSMTREMKEDTARSRRVTPFRSVPPADLAANGYVRRDGKENVYLAPDAQVLLSDEFLDGHCFRVVPGTGETAGMVGLAFEPVRGRRLPDVRGTMWLDPASAELRSVDFRYTELRGFATGDDWGGKMEFDRTDAGAWIVRNWTLRLPMMGRPTEPLGLSVANARVGVIGISEVGGEVLGSAASTRRAAGMVAGTVFDSTRSAPLAGARVVLAGTPFTALTDASGAFRMEGVPAGSYRVEFTHPRADSLRWKTSGAEVTVAAGGAGAVSLALPNRALARVAPPRRDSLEVVRLAGVTGTAAAESRVLRERGFYERKRRGMGTLWTGDDFRKQGDGRVTDHISGRRRILATPTGTTDGILFMQRRDGGRCWVPVFLDGFPVPAARLNSLQPEEIEAVEIYEGIDVPGEFNIAAHYRNEQRFRSCGAIVVWSNKAG